ncbi:MAG: hypothetical protein ABL903_15720 [Methylococcales bacterium]
MVKATLRFWLFVLMATTALPVCAATYLDVDYATLIQNAQRKGFVRVLIWLDLPAFLSPTTEQKLALEKKEAAVLAELGDTISPIAQQRNGLGGITLYATETALKRIDSSLNIRAVMKSSPQVWFQGADYGFIESIENEIIGNKFAEVEVILNLANFSYEFTRDASTLYKTSPELTAELLIKLPAFLDSLPAAHILNLTTLKTQIPELANQSKLLLRIDMEGLFAVQENKDIRALRLAKAPILQKAILDNAVIESAKRYGFADVSLNFQQPFGYSLDYPWIPDKAKQVQNATNRQIVKDFFSTFGENEFKPTDLSFSSILGAYARVSFPVLKQLYINPDPRLWRIKLNDGTVNPAIPPDPNNVGFTPSAEISLSEPTELCINPVEWSGDLNKTSIQYFLVVKPEDHFKEGDMFLAYRPINKPAELWFHSLTRGGSIWTKAEQNKAPVPYNVDPNFKLKPIFRMQTGKDFDSVNLANIEAPGEIIVGYGIGASPEDSFQDMFKNKMFESIWRSDAQNTTDYAYCLGVTKIKKESPWAPKVLGLPEGTDATR